MQTHLAVSRSIAPHLYRLLCSWLQRILARKKNRARQILSPEFQFLSERLIMGKLSRENLFGGCSARGAAVFSPRGKLRRASYVASNPLQTCPRRSDCVAVAKRLRCEFAGRVPVERRLGKSLPGLPAGPAARYTFCLLNLILC